MENQRTENRRTMVSPIRNCVIMIKIALARKVATTKNIEIKTKVSFSTAMVGRAENEWC